MTQTIYGFSNHKCIPINISVLRNAQAPYQRLEHIEPYVPHACTLRSL